MNNPTLWNLCIVSWLFQGMELFRLHTGNRKERNHQFSCNQNDVALYYTPWLKKIIWVTGVLRRNVVGDWCFDNLCQSHLHSQVKKFKNPSEQFDWSIDRVGIGKHMMKMGVKIGYVYSWIARWTINNVLLFLLSNRLWSGFLNGTSLLIDLFIRTLFLQ